MFLEHAWSWTVRSSPNSTVKHFLMDEANITVAISHARLRLLEAHVVQVLVQALLAIHYLRWQVLVELWLRAAGGTEASTGKLFAPIAG